MAIPAPKAAILLADGFEEIEAITLVDVLRRADVEVTLLGVFGLEVLGAHGVRVFADALLADAGGEAFEAVVLPGGMPGAKHLRDDPVVQAMLGRQLNSGGLLGAICAAPMALGLAGALQGHAATCYPGFEEHLIGAEVREQPVVEDRQVITSRGPGTAIAFALALARRLRGEGVAATVAKQLLVAA